MEGKPHYFNEYIRHFTCGECDKWWAIGDAPMNRDKWTCPWCGVTQEFEKDPDSPDV